MAHLLDRLLTRPSVKDEGLVRYFDDVWEKGVIGVPRRGVIVHLTIKEQMSRHHDGDT